MDADRSGSVREGGSIVVGLSAVPASLDPALATDPAGRQAVWLIHTSLLSYRHADGRNGTDLVPGLASALPTVSDDGLSYTLRLRRGLRYSDGSPVRAGDFARSVNRVRALHSPLARLYAGIDAIDADAASGTIRIALIGRDPAFADVLALPSSAPLPRGTPTKDLSGDPPPGVGPYRLERPLRGRRPVLIRNRGFRLPGVPPGHVDRIALTQAGSPQRQAQAVIAGTLDVTEVPPPIDLLPEVRSKYRDRYREDTSVSSVALVPGLGAPPLDDPAVRHAIGESIDGSKLARLYDGFLEPSCNVLPQVVRGYRALDDCPYGDPEEPPNLVDAKRQIEKSLAHGVSVSLRPDPGVPAIAARYVVRTLRNVGLRARLRRRGRAQLRLERLAPLIADPSAFLERFARTAFDPQLSRSVADAWAQATPGEKSDDAWASADERVVTQGYAVPLGSERRSSFFSERIDAQNCVQVQPLFGLDLSSLCLK